MYEAHVYCYSKFRHHLCEGSMSQMSLRNDYFDGTGHTPPGLQAGASWVERKGYIKKSVARDSHLGLWIKTV